MTKHPARARPGIRLRTGEILAAAAQVYDTSAVAGSLSAFLRRHADYVAAQRAVVDAGKRWKAERLRVERREAELGSAIERLAQVLAGYAEHPIARPFAAYGVPSPSMLKRLGLANRIRTAQRLAGKVRSRVRGIPQVEPAVAAAEKAAEALAAAHEALGEWEAKARAARFRRDAIGDRWDDELTTLNLEVRHKEARECPGLYAALFARTIRHRPRAR